MHNFAYFGTPDFSTFVLDELAEADFIPSRIITAPDKPAGRGLVLSAPPVKTWALTHGISVLQPASFDDGIIAELAHANIDFGIVAAYGKLLPARVLELFPRGILNLHPSLLPRYRGTSPVESQILADETEIGVSIIQMDEKMDHGPVIAQEKISIPHWPVDRHTANEYLWKAGGKLLVETLPGWFAGSMPVRIQDETRATVTKKIRKEDGAIDLAAPARENYLKYLAYAGWPGVYFFDTSTGENKRIKITSASLASDTFVIKRVIPEGKREMSYADFIRADG